MAKFLLRAQQNSYRAYLGFLLIFVGAVLFSAKAILVKLSYQYEVSAVTLLSLRMLFAFPVFLSIAIYLKPKDETKSLRPVQWVQVGLFGLMGYYAASLMDYLGLQFITASLERLILYVYPTIVVLLSAIVFRIKIQRLQYLALILTYIGMYVAFGHDLVIKQDRQTMIGVFWVFGAAFAYASYLVGSGSLIPKIGASRYNALSLSIASWGIIIHYLLAGDGEILRLEREVYYLAIATAIFSTVIPSFLISKGIAYIGANNAAIIGSVGPISTIILAHYTLGESINSSQWVGTLLVLVGVLMISLGLKKNG